MTAKEKVVMATAPLTTTARPGTMTVLYDGQCEFCRRSVRLLKRLDWRGRLHFADGRDAANLPPTSEPLNPRRLLEEMHVVTPDGRRVFHGFAAFRRIAWQLPPLWPLVPFLYIPGVPWLGQRVYLWVARNRFHLVPCHDGQCQVAANKKHGSV
jgi:predicted DCC family thiol-disulfide oxidoreductase YuxK